MPSRMLSCQTQTARENENRIDLAAFAGQKRTEVYVQRFHM